MLQWLFLSFNISPPKTSQHNVLKHCNQKPCKKRCNPPTYQKQYNANGEHSSPQPPRPTPSNHQGTCARIAAKSWITLSLWSSKGIPSTVLRFWMFWICVCFCWVMLERARVFSFYINKNTHTRGATSQEKTMKEGGWVVVFCRRHGLLKMCILYNFTWVVFKVAGGFYISVIQNETMYGASNMYSESG